MPDIIRLLPESIANQIAAGEVVQRPASVVKELLENSIDAGSSSVEIHIKEAGKQLIKIVDDGRGMSETDARMSFERHATSKISKSEDLFSIKTFGFRGEALASIAAVSQVELLSKTAQHDLGTKIRIEGSEIKSQEPAAARVGTSISVKNLFFNVPARRNFLKSNPVELRHIVDEVQRVALSNSEVEFQLTHNDQEIFNLRKGNLSQRIVGIFGENYRQQLVAVSENANELSVNGYIGKPNFAKKTRGEQFFFVNNRFIKSGYLNHAVQMAYEGLLNEGSHPFFTLFIELPPDKIDINVHPTKTEIKFEDERTIYGIIRAAVKQALGTHGVAPSIDFDMDVNFNFGQVQKSEADTRASSYAQFKTLDRREQTNIENWEKLYDLYQNTPSERKEDSALSLTFSSSANERDSDTEPAATLEAQQSSIVQFHNRFIFTAVKSGVMVVDQELAHERILYERFIELLEKNSGCAQQFLFPVAIELNPSDFELIMDIHNELTALGFCFEVFGKNSIKLTGAPTEVTGKNEKALFESIIEQYKQNQNALSLSRKENICRSLARRAGIKRGRKMQQEEMQSLIDSLFACKNPNYSPDGRATFYILALPKIEEAFK